MRKEKKDIIYETKLKLKLEKAKSWFVIAQITIILSGFLFASSGIYYSESQNTLQESYDNFWKAIEFFQKYEGKKADPIVYQFINSTIEESIFTKRLESKSQEDKFVYFLIGGIVTSIFSLLFFIIGRKKLKKLFLEI